MSEAGWRWRVAAAIGYAGWGWRWRWWQRQRCSVLVKELQGRELVLLPPGEYPLVPYPAAAGLQQGRPGAAHSSCVHTALCTEATHLQRLQQLSQRSHLLRAAHSGWHLQHAPAAGGHHCLHSTCRRSLRGSHRDGWLRGCTCQQQLWCLAHWSSFDSVRVLAVALCGLSAAAAIMPRCMHY